MTDSSRRRLLRGTAALPLAMLLPRARAQDPDAEALLAGASAAGGIDEGAGPHRLYVFYDPNCPYCHRLYLALRPHVAKGRLQVSWITLGFLMASSEAKAAAILQARDPLAALRKNEDDYDFAEDGQPGGGVVPARRIEPATRRILDRNLALYNAQHLYGVPVLVWKGVDGRAHIMVGGPSEDGLRALIAGLGT